MSTGRQIEDRVGKYLTRLMMLCSLAFTLRWCDYLSLCIAYFIAMPLILKQKCCEIREEVYTSMVFFGFCAINLLVWARAINQTRQRRINSMKNSFEGSEDNYSSYCYFWNLSSRLQSQ